MFDVSNSVLPSDITRKMPCTFPVMPSVCHMPGQAAAVRSTVPFLQLCRSKGHKYHISGALSNLPAVNWLGLTHTRLTAKSADVEEGERP